MKIKLKRCTAVVLEKMFENVARQQTDRQIDGLTQEHKLEYY